MTRLRQIYSYLAASAAMLAIHATAHAQQGGESSYSFLETPYSSHAYALGGSGIAVIDDDVTLAGCNPGLLGPEIESQISFNYMRWLGDSNFAGAHYAMAAGEHGAWGAGLQYLGYGTQTATDANGNITGEFAMKDIVINGMYSHDFTDRLRGGINIKAVASTYEQYSAFALAADIGINYYDEEKDCSLSLVLKNMGGQLKRFDHDYTRVPFDIQLGWMQRLGSSPFLLAVTARYLNKWSLPYYSHSTDQATGTQEETLKDSFASNLLRHLIFGLQYQPADNFYIALGYNNKTRTDLSTYQRNFLSGFSIGMGLKVKSFAFALSYAQPHKGGSTIMINLSTNIRELLRR